MTSSSAWGSPPLPQSFTDTEWRSLNSDHNVSAASELLSGFLKLQIFRNLQRCPHLLCGSVPSRLLVGFGSVVSAVL